MALTTNKRNKIIADYKSNRFETQTALLKHYKIDRKTLVKILEGISTSNAHIVEAGVIYKNALNSLKNPVEITSIETTVRERTILDEIEDIVHGATLLNVKGVKDEFSKPNVEINMYDRKTGQETLDKALITSGKAARHASSKTDISLNNQTNIQNNIAIEWE